MAAGRLRRVEAEDDGGGLGHVRVRHALPQRGQAVEGGHAGLKDNRNIYPIQLSIDEVFSESQVKVNKLA